MNNDIEKISHFQEVNGINLHYVTWGEFTRPERAILLVHGLTSSGILWEHKSDISLLQSILSAFTGYCL